MKIFWKKKLINFYFGLWKGFTKSINILKLSKNSLNAQVQAWIPFIVKLKGEETNHQQSFSKSINKLLIRLITKTLARVGD